MSRDPDQLLTRAGIQGDPRKDQHFLIDDRVLDRLPEYLCEIDADRSHILEIGPGTGALTDRLLAIGEQVTAIERDPELVRFLSDEFAEPIANDRLSVVHGDALEVALPSFSAVVANLPYGIASEILFRLLPARQPLVVTVQREFADRMVAEPGTSDYGRLSVSVGHYATAEILEPVPRTAFEPRPAVESGIVRLVPQEPTYEITADAFFLRLVKALFTQRRKTVRNGLRNTAHISGITDPEAVIDAVPAELLKKRPDAVSPEEFATIARHAITYTDD